MRGNNASKQLVLITVLTVILVFCVGALILLNLGLMDRTVPVSSSVIMSQVKQPSSSAKPLQELSEKPSESVVEESKDESSQEQILPPVSSEAPIFSCPPPTYYPPMQQKPQPQPQTVIDVLTFNDIGEYEESEIANYGYVYQGGIVIRNKTFNQNLIITDRASYDNVTLDNVVVKGNIYIEGGRTITLHDVSAAGVINQNNIIVTDLILSGNTNAGNLITKNSISVDEYDLSLNYNGVENVTIEEGPKVWQNFYLLSGKLETLYVNDVTNVSVSGGAEINNITAAKKTHLKGKGRVETFYVATDGVTFDLDPYYVYRNENCLPPEISKKSIGEL